MISVQLFLTVYASTDIFWFCRSTAGFNALYWGLCENSAATVCRDVRSLLSHRC